MKLLFYDRINVLVAIILCLDSQSVSAIKQPIIKLNTLDKCDATSSNIIKWNFQLENVDSDGYKIMDVDFDFTDTGFTDDFTYTLDIDKFNNGDWEENVYNDEGNLCEDLIKKFVLKAWNKMLQTIEPKPMDLCNAAKGLYNLKRFEVMKQDVQIPPLYGPIKAHLKLFDKVGSNIFCCVAELEITG